MASALASIRSYPPNGHGIRSQQCCLVLSAILTYQVASPSYIHRSGSIIRRAALGGGGVSPWIEVYSSGSPEPDIWRNVIIPAGNFSSCASLEVDSRATVECTVLRHKSTLLGFNYLPLSSRAHYIRPLFERHLEVDHNRAKQSLTRSDRKLF